MSQAWNPYATAPPPVPVTSWSTDAFGWAQVSLPAARRNPLRLVLLALIVLAAGALFGLAVTGLTAQPAASAYANEDYQVPAPDTAPPPIPVPADGEEAELWRRANPVYGQTMPTPVRCAATPVDIIAASRDELAAHFEALTECLARTWEPPLTAAGFVVTRPTVTLYDDQITTRCGNQKVNAFYCSTDQQLYFSTKLAPMAGLSGRWAADVVMAHEYGHLVQGRTGLFAAGVLGMRSAAGPEERLQVQRRLETQADCFSGTFLRSVSTSLGIPQGDLAAILDSYAAGGDDRRSGRPDVVGNHGLAVTRVYWGTVGLSSSELGRCNTFTAAAPSVR